MDKRMPGGALMALRGAADHPKTVRLGELLQLPPCCALGIMEALWHKTATYAPNGAIGRLSNKDIAYQLRWNLTTPDELVNAIVEAGFLDEHSRHRLVVHDWHVHSDNTLDAQLYRRGERYANGAIPRGKKLSRVEKAELFEKFYKQPAASLFSPESEAAGERNGTPLEDAVASNVIPFVPAPCGAAKRLPEPVPEPEPVPKEREVSAVAALEIACAHPWALQRHIRPPEVTPGDLVAVVTAVRAEAQATGVSCEVAAMALLEFTRGYARAVSQWPPGEMRYVMPIGKFFQTREYRNDPTTWRRDGAPLQHADRRKPGNSARSPAEQRHQDGLGQILEAFPELARHRGSGSSDGGTESELQHAGTAGGMGEQCAESLDRDRDEVRHRRPA